MNDERIPALTKQECSALDAKLAEIGDKARRQPAAYETIPINNAVVDVLFGSIYALSFAASSSAKAYAKQLNDALLSSADQRAKTLDDTLLLHFETRINASEDALIAKTKEYVRDEIKEAESVKSLERRASRHAEHLARLEDRLRRLETKGN